MKNWIRLGYVLKLVAFSLLAAPILLVVGVGLYTIAGFCEGLGSSWRAYRERFVEELEGWPQ